MELAGNFAEPRLNHFHGGIDIKTEHREGIAIYATSGGYVSHIGVSRYGAGRCLTIAHPGGYSSYYYHLKAFSPKIRYMVEHAIGKEMSRSRQPGADEECDISLKPGQLMVGAGELIARSGNSGASEGAHLHFEIHDSKGVMLDPLEFLGTYIKDTTPPMAHAFMACPQAGRGIFEESVDNRIIGFTEHELPHKYTAWGLVGFALNATDYADMAYNRLGVRHTWLLCDGDTVCHIDAGMVPRKLNREIDAWGDYYTYMRSKQWYLKSYRPHGVHLPMIETPNSKYPQGLINFREERDYHLIYILADILGNTTKYSFTVHAQPAKIPSRGLPNLARLVRYDQMFCWQNADVQLMIPPRNVAESIEIEPQKTAEAQGGALSDTYTFATRALPLFHSATLRIKLKRQPKPGKKLMIAADYGTWQYIPVEEKGGWVSGQIRELGAHYHVIEVAQN